MWLFHSVTQSDLNPECLRWKLLEHFLHPGAARARPGPRRRHGDATDTRPSTACSSSGSTSGSRTRGYRVLPQVPAYGYRIDLVVTGGESRLAVECDGDEWHGPEQLRAATSRASRISSASAGGSCGSARASSTSTPRPRCARCG